MGGGGEGRNFEKVSKVCKLISKIVAVFRGVTKCKMGWGGGGVGVRCGGWRGKNV